ncbi:MAG TPA: GGDEF domain-containing protein, partial [Roseiflexaceae bacterium]|nr:GGDEF domain-containing protein [Roseiflexaceae bacterium]
TGLLLTHTTYVLLITLVWFILAIARYALHRSFPRLVQHNERLARGLFLGLLFAGGLWLSMTTSLTFYLPELQAALLPMIIVSSVLCASATFTLAIDRVIRIGMPLAILAPAMIGLLFHMNTTNLTFVLLIMIFLLYLFSASKTIHRDYWNAVEARALLQQRAEEFEKLSITDAVTKIPNRRYFERRFVDEWSRAFRHDEILSVLLIDIDHFKRINDTYGHPFGDRCLAEVAVALKRNVYRDVDFLARYGGEEFVVVLPDTPSGDAFLVGERLREAVANLEISVDGVTVQLTCSIGLISVAPTTTRVSADIAIMLADQALYAAKSAGRNRTMVAQAP